MTPADLRALADAATAPPWRADETPQVLILPLLVDLWEAADALMAHVVGVLADPDVDPLPEEEWDPTFVALRDALAALKETDQ